MNNMTEAALLQEITKLTARLDRLSGSHNTLVNKTVQDLDQHAGVLRQIATGLQSLEQRIVVLEQGRPLPPAPQPQAQRQGPVPVPQPQTAPQPTPQVRAAVHPMSAGWADDEEDAQLEE
jgi:hypothetical protein